jgi:hypothetical protein
LFVGKTASRIRVGQKDRCRLGESLRRVGFIVRRGSATFRSRAKSLPTPRRMEGGRMSPNSLRLPVRPRNRFPTSSGYHPITHRRHGQPGRSESEISVVLWNTSERSGRPLGLATGYVPHHGHQRLAAPFSMRKVTSVASHGSENLPRSRSRRPNATATTHIWSNSKEEYAGR